ncbi:MAG: MerR family transcriptional regulator [Verrucomicrobia bacterium]|nr:MerR family transcriptional regulator [Verrucomicrobiota bacterium]
MNTPPENDSARLPIFEPDMEATYSLEVVVELTGVNSQAILHYREQGLISVMTDPESGAHYFDDAALRTLRRIEHLRAYCEMNDSGLRLVLRLLEDMERLEADLNARR